MAFTFDTSAKGALAATNFTYSCGANTKILYLGLTTAATTARTGGSPTFSGTAFTQVGLTQSYGICSIPH